VVLETPRIDGYYTADTIRGYIKKLCGTSFQHSIFMLFLLSHGENDCSFLTSDMQYLSFRKEVLEPLQKSSSLTNALKIFVLNTCRTASVDEKIKERSGGVVEHTIFIQSSIANNPSYRGVQNGSQFIHYFVKILEEHYQSKDFMQMMNIINQKMSGQSCEISHSLNGMLFLFPNVILLFYTFIRTFYHYLIPFIRLVIV
jgi:hypothetical protein